MIERDETLERFLAAIAEKVDPDAIAEVHLFHPIKQGNTQSGVAVVAVNEGLSSIASDSRMGVYTAKYRLMLKGPDRGKWEFAMHADADAPLITVDRVVRGVQRRSGDADDPRRITGAEFLDLLPPGNRPGGP